MDAVIGTTPPYAGPKAIAVPVQPAVAPAPKPPRANQDSSSGTDSGTQRREVAPDATTGALVFRIVEVATGAITMQTPTDARLKLRAYIDGVLKAGSKGSAVTRSA